MRQVRGYKHRNRVGYLTLALLETFTGGRAAERLHQVRSAQVVGSLVIPSRDRLGHGLGGQGGTVQYWGRHRDHSLSLL